MKKLFFLLLSLLFVGQTIFAQVSISTSKREDFTWSDSKKEWVLATSNNEEATLFQFNKEETMFKHITTTITSTYYINSFEKDTEDGNKLIYDIISDVGNKYIMIIDFTNNNLRFIGKFPDGSHFMVRHTIKKIF